MSAASRSTVQVRRVHVLNNVLWLDTLMVGIHCDFDVMKPGEYAKTEPGYHVYSQEGKFYIQVGIYSPTEIYVSLRRVLENPAVRPDPGYYLEMYFTLLNSQLPPVRKVMDFRHDEAGVLYDMDLIKSEEPGTWTVKCVIKMIEVTSLRKDDMKRQNDDLKAMLTRWDPKGVKTAKLAFLLNRPNLDALFTGLQDDEFAYRKMCLLERTLGVVDEIAKKLNMLKINKTLETSTPVEVYLGYILHGHIDGISKDNCVRLFLSAHRYGLEFLRVLCIEFFEKHLDDNDYLIDILRNASIANEGDKKFMNRALGVFLFRINTIMVSEKWKKYFLEDSSVVYSILDLASRRSTVLRQTKEAAAHNSAQLPETTG